MFGDCYQCSFSYKISVQFLLFLVCHCVCVCVCVCVCMCCVCVCSSVHVCGGSIRNQCLFMVTPGQTLRCDSWLKLIAPMLLEFT